MDRILIKLGENVGTTVRLIVLKFHKNQFSVDVIMTSFLFLKLFLGEATLLKGKQFCAKENNYAAPDCDTGDSGLVSIHFIHSFSCVNVLLHLHGGVIFSLQFVNVSVCL